MNTDMNTDMTENINSTGSNLALFTDTNVPKYGLPIPVFSSKGGKKISKKNISHIYKKMPRSTIRKMKRRIRSKYASKSRKNKTRSRRSKVMRGGNYAQFLGGVPLTQGYSLGGELSKYESALASNGGIMKPYNTCANAK